MRLRHLVQRVFGLAGATAASQVLTGFAYVIAARSMGPKDFGLYSVALAIASVVAGLFDFGLTSFVVREVASGRMQLGEFSGVQKTKRLFVPLGFALTFVPASLVIHSWLNGAFVGLLFVTTWEAVVANARLRSQERFAGGIVNLVVGRVISVVLIVSLVTQVRGGAALIAGLTFGSLYEACADLLILRRGHTSMVSARGLFHLQKEAVPYGLMTIVSLAQQLDMPLVAFGGGATAAGLYAAASRLLNPLTFLSASLSQAAVPTLSRLSNDFADLRHYERSVLKMGVAIALTPLIAAAVGFLLLPVLLGHQFESSKYAFIVLAVGAVFGSLDQPLAALIQNRRVPSIVVKAAAQSVVVGLLLTPLFAYIAGPAGAAAGYLVTHFFLANILSLKWRRLRNEALEVSPVDLPA